MILIIGATGHAGGAVAKELLARGQKVRAALRNTAKGEGLRQIGVDVVQGDADQPESVKAALVGVEKILIATGSDERLADTQKKIIAAVKGSVKSIAKISALGASTDSPVRLLRVHGIADEELQNSGVPFTIIQPVFFMQNFLQSAGTIAAQNIIVSPTGNGREGTIDVRDVGIFGATVLTENGHDKKRYGISSRDSLSGAEVAEKLSLALGKKIQFISPAPEDYKRTLLSFGVPEWIAAGLIELYAFVARGEGDVLTDTFHKVTRKEPISFDQFAADHAQVFLQAA